MSERYKFEDSTGTRSKKFHFKVSGWELNPCSIKAQKTNRTNNIFPVPFTSNTRKQWLDVEGREGKAMYIGYKLIEKLLLVHHGWQIKHLLATKFRVTGTKA